MTQNNSNNISAPAVEWLDLSCLDGVERPVDPELVDVPLREATQADLKRFAVISDASLSARAQAVMLDARKAAENASTPRHGNTGGTSRRIEENKGEKPVSSIDHDDVAPQTTPPSRVRKSRAKRTSSDMEKFLDEGWFYDWLSLTIPNSTDGKGKKSAGPLGDFEGKEASRRLFLWASVSGLHVIRIGKGTDGYYGGAHLAREPVDTDRISTIRDGHSTNMPNIEITGSNGECAKLGPAALRELGPVLVARVDVTRDVSKTGLWDDLNELCVAMAEKHGMEPPRYDGREGAGRTIYIGKGEASVRIYEKDFERLSQGLITEDQVDPDLVRFEITFRPKKGKKSAFADIARDKGPGALIGTTRWVREMVKQFAVLADYASASDAEIAVTRLDVPPDPRPIEIKAQHGLKQYRKTTCKAAVARTVDADFDGDWRKAVVDRERVKGIAIGMYVEHLDEVIDEVISDLGVDCVMSHEEEAERASCLLDRWIDRQREQTEQAQIGLLQAAAWVRDECMA